MGEISEMMLDGSLCAGCGVYLGMTEWDCPMFCRSCKKDQRGEAHDKVLKRHQAIKKIPCPTCAKRVKSCGLKDHMRDAHGVKS
jgi:hypothetical protein